MRLYYIWIIALHFTLGLQLSAQGTVKLSELFVSNTTDDSIAYSIYLPPNYSSEKTYPIMYLLHGFGGDETSILKVLKLEIFVDSLNADQSIPEVIIVMPDGRRSYYMNDYKNKFPFEDVFIGEFIPAIESIYSANERAIAGMSMGGFGATILSIKNSGFFSTSINLSGAVRSPGQFMALSPEKYQSYFSPIFGDSLLGMDRLTDHWKANSPYFLVNDSTAKQLDSINWYIDCGMQDYLLPANKALHVLFTQNKIDHEFLTRPGVHNWSYWRKGLINALVYWSEILE